MRLRDLRLTLEENSSLTLTRRVAGAIEKAIQDGRLPPGVALPGSRSLSEMLGVTRNTVIAAIQNLEEQGWLISEPNRGTFVATRLPAHSRFIPHRPEAGATSFSTGFDLPSRLAPVSELGPEVLALADGLPDHRLAPSEELAKAYQRALRRHGGNLLKQGEPMGNELLRSSLAEWLSERHGVAISESQVLITRGSRMGLQLLASALLRSGDAVGFENPGNRSVWETLGQIPGLIFEPLTIDAHGLQVGPLAELLSKRSLRALYLTPRRQFPTGVGLTPDRAKTILELSSQHRVAILEDDSDGEFALGNPQARSLLSMDSRGQVVFIGSLSRLLAPGIRLGFLIAPPALAVRLARLRMALEWQGDRVLEWAMADLIRDGELSRHIRKTQKIYERRRAYLAQRLAQETHLPLEVQPGEGGMALWIRNTGNKALASWIQTCHQCGLALKPPAHYYFDGPLEAFRMGFSQLDETQIDEAVRRLTQAWDMTRA